LVKRFAALLFLAIALATLSFAQTTLTGAGATFPYPMYSKWFSDYHKLHPDIAINYQSIGSGGGIAQVSAGTVDFGASDGPMSDEQLSKAKSKIVHIPTVLGAVVPAYNVPGVKEELKFTPEALAGIFLGRITSWNDNAIQSANKDVKLPNTPIVVVHRSEGSGTTYVWTDYLSKVNPDWKSGPGKGASIKWPVGLGAKGNEGVSGQIRQVEGAIGYIELIYALQNKISFGVVKNSSGNFVKASLESVTAAAQGAKIPNDYRVSITNPPGKDAYPISSFTWLLIPEKATDPNKGKILVDFLNWMLTDGQKGTADLSYAPLPQELVGRVKGTVQQLQR
jgi:phosphate transport system substrate-binding protein